MTKIKFTKNFATRKKGDTADVDGVLAAILIKKGVAKSITAKESASAEK